MTPPTFARETREADTQDKRWAWMIATAEEGAREGNAYFVVTFDSKTLTVKMEGWEKKPDQEN